jgi:acetyl-CoA synthetase
MAKPAREQKMLVTDVNDSILREPKVFLPSAAMSAQAAISGMDAYRALVAEAERDYEGFWRRLANETLTWKKPFTKVLDECKAPFHTWFEDGELNASYNCLDRHIEAGNGERVAVIFEADDGTVTHVTYQDLLQRVCRFANALKKRGVKKGDRVVIYMPMSVEGVVAMQACARIGATHSVVFGGFSSKSLNERLVNVGAIALVTCDEQMRGGKALPLKSIADEALAMGGCEAVKSMIVYQRTGGKVAWHDGRDLWMHELMQAESDQCAPEWVGAEHPLFILYTSGSTGTPKGVQHSTGGFLLWAAQTMKWTFDWKPTDVFWCTADIGWITGHSYIAYGPTALGATQVMFEGVPTYPNAGRFWDMIARHKVTLFYTAPTAIRSLIKLAEADVKVHPASFDLSTLRILGTVGEPINPAAWMWYYEHVGGGRCPVADTWWQTETGGHMIAPMPGATPLVPGSCTLPLPGIMAAVVDETGQDEPDGKGGLLVIKRPVDAAHGVGRSSPLREGLFPGRTGRQAVSRRRRRGARQGHRLFHHHGTHRRRAECVRAPARHDGDRVRAGGQSACCGGCSGRMPGRDNGRNRRRFRGAEGATSRRQRSREDC